MVTSHKPAEGAQRSDPDAATSVRRGRLWFLGWATLVLFILTTALWIKSYWKGNGIRYLAYTYAATGSADRSIWDAEIICGSLILGHDQQTLTRRDEVEYSRTSPPHGLYIYSPQPKYAYVRNLTPSSLQNHLGFYILKDSGTAGPGTFTRLVIPGWFVLLVLAAPAPWMVIRVVRSRRRIRDGRCRHCGYDLRASKERCPECGTAIPAPKGTGGKA